MTKAELDSFPILADVLVKIRKSRGFTQQEWAKLLGVATNTVHEWEKNRRQPKAFNIQCIHSLAPEYSEQTLVWLRYVNDIRNGK